MHPAPPDLEAAVGRVRGLCRDLCLERVNVAALRTVLIAFDSAQERVEAAELRAGAVYAAQQERDHAQAKEAKARAEVERLRGALEQIKHHSDDNRSAGVARRALKPTDPAQARDSAASPSRIEVSAADGKAEATLYLNGVPVAGHGDSTGSLTAEQLVGPLVCQLVNHLESLRRTALPDDGKVPDEETARVDTRERERLRREGIDATDIRDLRNALTQDPVPDCKFDAVRVYRPLLEAVVEALLRDPTPPSHPDTAEEDR